MSSLPAKRTRAETSSSATVHYASINDGRLFEDLSRKNAEDWHSYFMALACLLSTRSRDPKWKVGACIVNKEGHIVGQGYNGMLNNAPENTFPWGKKSTSNLETKTLFVCHAEMNAIAFSNLTDFDGCTMYVSTFPCIQCAMRIKAVGISHVYFLDVQSNEGRETEIKNAESILTGLIRRTFIRSSVTFDFTQCEIFKKGGAARLPNREPQGGVKKITFEVRELISKKEVDRMKWEHLFFAICLIEAQKSDEEKKLGACVVNKDNHIVGWGHNRRAGSEPETEVHAGMIAVLRAGPALKNATLYTLQHPCNECAKSMIQRGVGKVIYLMEPRPTATATYESAEWMFKEMGVFTRFFNLSGPTGAKNESVEVTFKD